MPHLGLVCVTAGDAIRFRTVPRTRLRQLPDPAAHLRDLYRDNLARLAAAVDFCHARGIQLYRMSSSLFPFADDPLGAPILEALAPDLVAVGRRILDTGLRVVAHPDQYVVLNSERPDVVKNARLVLETQARIMDLIGLPRSPWAALTIHGGKGGRGPQLVDEVHLLPPAVQSRLVLENDERAYGAEAMLELCRAAGVPMVFDAHHHLVHDALDSYDHASMERFLFAARDTWPDPAWQLVHISNGRDSLRDPCHHDYVSDMPACFAHAPWIEVEAKAKELAIESLQQALQKVGR